jgi:ABC-2 type transport system ATP-binding protein
VFQIENLVKTFGEIRAVDGISFEVRPGEIYGLLGPNGAGKTTALSMMCSLLKPDAGRIFFDGIDLAHNPIKVKGQLGVVPQETALYEELSAKENLRFWGGIYDLSGKALSEAVDRTLELLGLTARSKDAVKTFSGGMKRRLNLGVGLVHSPRAILLDEPTVGIDPQARNNILDVVKEITSNGTTVVYTTHYLEEAETLCDRIGIMDHGKLLAEGTLEELKKQAGEEEIVTVRGSFNAEAVRKRLEGVNEAKLISEDPGKMVFTAAGSGRGAVEILTGILGKEPGIEGISVQPPSLNSLFLNLTGRELRD